MFFIDSTNARKWRWISAVVATIGEADAQIAAIPEPERAHHRIVEFDSPGFPVFMIEDQGFEFGDLTFVRCRLRQLAPSGDEDAIHFNVYAFDSPFIPERPGRDEMGRVLHWHVCDSTLSLPRSKVFDAELQAVAESASEH